MTTTNNILSPRDQEIIANPLLAIHVNLNGGEFHPVLSVSGGQMRVWVNNNVEVFEADKCVSNPAYTMEPGTFDELDHCC